MDIVQVIVIFLCVFAVWVTLRFTLKFLYKITLLFLILVISFFLYFNFSQKNIFDTMSELYCVEKKSTETFNNKCECFVENILDGFKLRNDSLNQGQINEIKNNTFKSLYEFHESYKIKKEDIADCFEKNGSPGGLGEEIKNNLIENVKKTTSLFDFFKKNKKNDTGS